LGKERPVSADDGARLIAGRYLLISEVGRGAMGVVWLARDERLGRTVAVKELRPGVGLSGTQVRQSSLRARREARIAASLQHPNAVAVYDVVDHDERPYLVMEFVESRSLAEVLAERQVLDPAEAVEIGAQMASALVAAHEIGIVHRDIKPANILLTESGVAKLTDFGISRAAGDVTVTATGEMLGTPAYVAPEIAQGRPASAASDVFSLGATLYAAVEGEPPFGTGPSAIALLLRIVNDEIRPPERVSELTETLMWMLRNDPADRPTMEAARRSLRAVAAATAPPEVIDLPITAPLPDSEAEPESVDTPPESADSGSGSGSGSGSTPGSDPGDRPVAAVAASAAAPASASAAAAEKLPSGPASTSTNSRKRLLPWWAWLGVLAMLTAGIVAIVVATSSPSSSKTPPTADSSTHTTSPSATTSKKPTATATATAAAGSKATASTSPRTTASTTTSTTASASTTASISTQLTSAITNYYKLVPGDLNDAWNYMTADYQTNHAGGPTGYRDFWDQISSVSLSDVVAQPPSTVIATITYDYKNGQTVQERTSFGLVLSDGIWKIASSSVLSSTSS
jgi:eukaryotic-like serine/threonine-protein kinase